MDFKKQAQQLKIRAKELGYDLKLTHAQELLASANGHRSRHSALKVNCSPQPVAPSDLNPGMRINHNCQLCEKRPRSVRVMTKGDRVSTVFLLCQDCASTGWGKDATRIDNPHYDFNSTYLRDIFFNSNPGETNHRKTFIFRLICSDESLGDRYLVVPGLWSGYSTQHVWNVDKQQEALGHDDWKIEVLPYPFLKLK